MLYLLLLWYTYWADPVASWLFAYSISQSPYVLDSKYLCTIAEKHYAE